MNNQNDLQALENIERQWAGIVHAARSQDKTTSAILNSTSNVRPIKVERNVVTLEVSSQFFFDKLQETSHRNVLEKSLENVTGIGYSVVVVLRPPQPTEDTQSVPTMSTAPVLPTQPATPISITTPPEPTPSQKPSWRDASWQQVILAFISILLAIGGIALTVYLLPKKELQIVVDSTTSLVDVRPEAAGDIEIRYKGQRVNNVTLIQTRLTNSGNQPIRTDDFSRALAFVFDEQTQVIDYTVTSTVPSNIGMVLTQTLQYRIEVLPLLLNPGDTATLRFIAIRNDNSAANFRVDTRIEGIRDVQFSDATINNYNPWRGVISIISGLLVGAVIIVISILKIRLRTRIILISLIIIISLLFASSLQFLLP